MVLLHRLPSAVCLLANTEVRYLPTMLILLVLTEYCSMFILGELIQSFAYSQTLSVFILAFDQVSTLTSISLAQYIVR
jgi:hypothetical protein